MIRGKFVAQIEIDISHNKKISQDKFNALRYNIRNQWKEGIKELIEEDLSACLDTVEVRLNQMLADLIQYDEEDVT